MKIGISPNAIRGAAELVELARRIEAAGLDAIWVPNHLAFFGSPVADPFQAIAAFAAGSSKLALGTSVFVLPAAGRAATSSPVSAILFRKLGSLTEQVDYSAHDAPNVTMAVRRRKRRRAGSDDAEQMMRSSLYSTVRAR